MFVGKLKVKIRANGPGGKWKQGVLPVTKDIMDELGWKEQDVIVTITPINHSLPPEVIKKKMDQYSQIVEIEDELKKIRKMVTNFR